MFREINNLSVWPRDLNNCFNNFAELGIEFLKKNCCAQNFLEKLDTLPGYAAIQKFPLFVQVWMRGT